MKKISIIYVYYNTPKEIHNSIKSLELSSIAKFSELIIVNNNSPKKLPRDVLKNKNIKVLNNRTNVGFGPALNQGAKIATGKYLLFLNPDTITPPGFIKKLIIKLNSDPKIGLLGVRYTNEYGEGLNSVGGFPTFQSILYSFSFLYKIFPKNKNITKYWMSNFNYTKEQEVLVVGGACMITRSDLFEKIGGFDEQFFMYFEEADFSERIRRAGYKVIYYPDITITHLVGRSSTNKDKIKKTFEKSRFKIIKKYEGLPKAIVAELVIRYTTATNLALILIFALSLFLNLYKLDSLMMFYGDFGRDYLAARDLLLTGDIPLRGIPSSVVWLHQGPLSIYFIALALFIGNFTPVAPAFFYGFLGAITTILTYMIGRDYFSKKIGILSAIFFATSPLVLINIRQPYHTSPIPFFTAIFFILLLKIIQGKTRYLPILFFIFGLLFLLELSNSLIILVVFLSLFIYKPVIKKVDILGSFIGFALGVLPFIIFDLKNNFIQLGGFSLWVINRLRLFFGVASEKANITETGNAFFNLTDELVRFIFPQSLTITGLIVLCVVIAFYHKRKELIMKKEYMIILLWILIPFIGFLIHAKPGTAYTPILFSGLAIILGLAFSTLIKINKLFIFVFISIVVINTTLVLKNNYYMTTANTSDRPELYNYSYGLDLSLREKASEAIVKDARGNKLRVLGGGYLNDFSTSVDNYKYLICYKGGNINDSARIVYRIYENKSEIKNIKSIIYQNKYIAVTKNEK